MGYFDDLIDPAPAVTDASAVDAGSSASATEPVQDATETAAVESDSTSGETETVISETNTDESETNGSESASSTDHAGAVPDAIASRPVTGELLPRFNRHAPVNDILREDWIKAIRLSPDRFHALLFRAVSPSEVVIDDDGFEVTEAERIAPNQETLSYADPELVDVVDCPDEMADFYAMNDTDENTGLLEDALILRIAAHNISIGSILEWNEALASGESIRRWWYVHRKFNYGTASVGTLYYCVPSRSYEGLLDE